jgi:transglutaminase 1
MMHYPGTSVRRLSIVDIARKPWYDESRHAVDPGSAAERMSSMNAARSVERSQPMFDNRPISDDVYFDLIEQDKVAWGQPFNLQVHIQVLYYTPIFSCFFRILFANLSIELLQNRSQEMRTITTILSANSVYYTGVTARRLGRNDRQFVLQPGGRTLLFPLTNFTPPFGAKYL